MISDKSSQLSLQVDQSYSLDRRHEDKTGLSGEGRQEEEMSDTFEEYLEKSNMLCSQEGVDHYFLPNSHKTDFV